MTASVNSGSFLPGAGQHVGRAALVMDFEGDVLAKLREVEFSLQDIADTARNTSQRVGSGVTSGFNAGLTGLQSGFHAAMTVPVVAGLSHVGQQFQALGAMVSGSGEQILHTFAGWAGELFHVGQTFQGIRAQFDGLFGANADERFARMQQIATRTLLSTADVAQQAIFLQRSGVDALNVMGQTARGALPALEILSDLAASQGAMGRSSLRPAISNFLAGQVRSLQMRFDLSGPVVRQLNQILHRTDDVQERFQGMIDVLGPVFGGAGDMMAHTIGFQLEQVKDNLEHMFGVMAAGAITVIGPFVEEFANWMREFREAEASTNNLRGALEDVAGALIFVIRPVVRLGQLLAEFAQANPMIVKWTILFTLFAAVVMIIIGGLITAFGTLLANIVLITVGLTVLPILLAGIAAALAIIAVPLAAIAAVIGLPLWAAWEANLFGIRSTVTTLRAAFQGLYEIITSLSEDGIGRLSEQTNEDLQRLGIRDQVVSWAAAFWRFKIAAEAVWRGVTQAATAAWAVLQPVIESLFGQMFGDGPSKNSRGGSKAAETLSFLDRINSISPEQWQRFGTQVGETIGNIIFGIQNVTKAIQALIFVFNVLKKMWDAAALVMGGVWASILLPVTLLVSHLQLMASVLMRIGEYLTGTTLGAYVTQQLDEGTRTVEARTSQGQAPVHAPTAVERQAASSAEGQSAQQQLVEAVRELAGPKVTGRAGQHKATAVVKLEVDGRRIAEAVADSDQRERQRMGVGE